MERDYTSSDVKIKSFRGDNGVYKAAQFRNKFINNEQKLTLCGAGTHHQNDITKSYIHTMVENSRIILLNANAR